VLGVPVIKLVEAAPRPVLSPNNPKTAVQLALLYLKRVIHKPVLHRLIVQYLDGDLVVNPVVQELNLDRLLNNLQTEVQLVLLYLKLVILKLVPSIVLYLDGVLAINPVVQEFNIVLLHNNLQTAVLHVP
jgi:hypothetical protein